MRQFCLLALLSTLVMTACQPQPKVVDYETDSSANSARMQNLESSELAQAQTSVENEGEIHFKKDGTRRAWTQYDHYARINDHGYAYYMEENPDISSEIYPLNGESNPKVLLFTFDDAPQMPESYALDIAKELKAKNVNAIFLVNGMYLMEEEGRRITKEIYDMGFEIGNHSQHHPNLKELTYDQQFQELNATSQLVEDITGEKPRWFRPPFGLFNRDTYDICQELEMQLMTWNFGYDWMDDYLEADSLLAISLDNDYLRSGANILMHDRLWTSEAIGRMVDGYREQGFHIVDPLLIQKPDFSKEG